MREKGRNVERRKRRGYSGVGRGELRGRRVWREKKRRENRRAKRGNESQNTTLSRRKKEG